MAFDTIDHNILLDILSTKFGVKDTALDWFESYLRPRGFQVQIHSDRSTVVDHPFCGVPSRAYLLRTNDWMDTHEFLKHIKVQRFCLTLAEARLWYESIRLINVDWVGLQNIFRQQYSKIGKTTEQLFHMWRSISF